MEFPLPLVVEGGPAVVREILESEETLIVKHREASV